MRCNLQSLWDPSRAGILPAKLEWGKQSLLSIPRNHLGQGGADKSQGQNMVLQSCSPPFSARQLVSPISALSQEGMGRCFNFREWREGGDRLWAARLAAVSEPNPDCTTLPLLPGRQQTPVTTGKGVPAEAGGSFLLLLHLTHLEQQALHPTGHSVGCHHHGLCECYYLVLLCSFPPVPTANHYL